MLYVAKEAQAGQHAAVVSHGSEKGDWVSEFYETNDTRDLSSFLAADAGLDFIAALGGEEAVKQYEHALVEKGAAICAAAWGTQVLDSGPFGAMRCVFLPGDEELFDVGGVERMLSDRGVQCKLNKGVMRCGAGPARVRSFVRLSARVYNERSDYVELAAKLLECVAQQR